MIARTVAKLMAPVARKVRLIARRAVVALVYDDPKLQELQLAIFSGEIRDTVERWQDYGFTSHPLPGAEAIVLGLGGNTDHGAVIKVDDRRYRLRSLAQGEVALYDDQGQVVHLKRDKSIHIYGCDRLTVEAAVQITIDTPLLTVSGDIHADGEVSDGVRMMSGDREIYNGHTHPGDSGGTTSHPNQEM